MLNISSNSEVSKARTSSPLKLSFVGKFSQTSSRQGRERSFPISSLSKKRILPPQSFNSSADINNCSMGCLTKFCIMGILNSSFGERPISSFLERSLSTLYSFLRRTLPSTFSIMEKVFQRSDVQTSRATHFLQSPILAEDQIDLKSISLEALLKKLPVFVNDSNRLTYPFNALVFINVTSEFHSLAMSHLLVIFS